jgi:hypothetical protein
MVPLGMIIAGGHTVEGSLRLDRFVRWSGQGIRP